MLERHGEASSGVDSQNDDRGPSNPFTNILRRHKKDVAFIVGNGINRFNSHVTGNSWADLLLKLWNRRHKPRKEIPEGISFIEFFDIMDLDESGPRRRDLQKAFCDLMSGWQPGEHHERFIAWAIQNRAPVLTTNFENVLGEAGGCRLHRVRGKRGFTDFYPWESYRGRRQLTDPLKEFGIWHINGMQRYHRSIRLGLTHYMGSVERARMWLHAGRDRSLFVGENQQRWPGADTWLQVLFNKKLVILGLGLDQTEVFLRWLLIERARYFRRFPERKKPAWYVHAKDRFPAGKELFLSHIGIRPLACSSFEQIYEEPWG